MSERKLELSDFCPCIIREDNDGCFISDSNGFLMPAEQMIEVAQKLLLYAVKNKSNIEVYNQKRGIEFEKELSGWKSSPKAPKPKEEAYVYLFECGGLYKIGASKDVERRAAELDRRPSPLIVRAVSNATVRAFEMEQELHEKLKKYKINGEWYDFPEDIVKRLAQLIYDFGGAE